MSANDRVRARIEAIGKYVWLVPREGWKHWRSVRPGGLQSSAQRRHFTPINSGMNQCPVEYPVPLNKGKKTAPAEGQRQPREAVRSALDLGVVLQEFGHFRLVLDAPARAARRSGPRSIPTLASAHRRGVPARAARQHE